MTVGTAAGAGAGQPPADGGTQDRYKWVALSNTTIGVLMATIDASIVLISLPAIFRGIGLNPLTTSNTSYLLWMLMGYMVVTAVLVVSFGRIGDMFGRVKMYNLGFAVFTAGSLAASLTYFGGSGAALYLIAMRIVQGIGGAMVMANSTAILTDAFPENERGMALGINTVAGIAGSFIGLVAGGLLATIDWHLIFYVSVPIGLFGTIWAYLKLREVSKGEGGRLDWPGNLLFGIGLVAVLVGITYAIQPYGGSDMGWLNPLVLGCLIGGVLLLAGFVLAEMKVPEPMFDLRLFRIRAFMAGNLASLFASIGRGGLMFMLIIWLQGIWLPLHGYSFTSTPLWAGIYMLPLTGGFLIAGPLAGRLSDRFGARPFATGGMIVAAITFGLLMLLPADFTYWVFALLLLANGLAMGLFAAPNTAGIMNSVPRNRRGAASGMRSTFQNAGMTLSIGIFFTIMVIGLSATMPAVLTHSLSAEGVAPAAVAKVAALPPVSVLFAAFLGYNPMRSLLGPTLKSVSAAHRAVLTGPTFFSQLIAGPFHHGLVIVFSFALIICLLAAAASWLRGGRQAVAAAALAADGNGADPSAAVASASPATPAAAVTPAGSPTPAGHAGATPPHPGAAPGISVVTVSGSFGAGSREVARRLADELGLPFVDRAVPLQVAERLGLPPGTALARDEHADGVLVRSLIQLIGTPVSFGVSGVQSTPATDEEVFRATTEKVLKEIAAGPGGVILGRAAAVVLAGLPGALHVRLDGPANARMERAARDQGLGPEAAWDLLRRNDRARTAYVRHLYGQDPEDPALYHMVLDSTVVPIDACVAAIVAMATGSRAIMETR
jgi:EmrB/QacA subfamily drug resistance transporter